MITKQYFKIAMSLVLMVVFSRNIQAQKADSLFVKHFKWGVTGQFNIFKGATITENHHYFSGNMMICHFSS